MPNNWVNQTAGSSVALIAVKFSGRRWLPLALGVNKMKLISIFFIFLLATPAFAAGPSSIYKLSKKEKSPLGDISVFYYRSNEEVPSQIWLSRVDDSSSLTLLYEYNRDASALFSPDQNYVLINDYAGSNVSMVQLLKQQEGLKYKKIKEADVTGQSWTFFSNRYGLPKGIDLWHTYIEGLRWPDDSRAILLVLWGHTDSEHYLNNWYLIYDISALAPTLDLTIMNRDSVHIKEATKSNTP